MATFTLTANSNYSAIKGSLANNDTIDCDGFRLTVDEAPALTGIAVTSPGTAGRMTVNGAYDMSTWSITAGTAALIDGTFPSGATLGSATGGTATGAHGINSNAGTVTTANPGSGTNAFGVNNNTTGTVTNAVGGSANAAINQNTGTVVNSTGGSTNGAQGVSTNNGTVENSTGGSAGGAHGVANNNGTVLSATGGSAVNANGVLTNNAIVFAADDATGNGVRDSFSAIKVVDGPNYKSRIITLTTRNSPVTTVYSIGTLSNLADLDPGITVITVNTGTGPAAKPNLRGGFAN
jgi:hypothetical protein